MSNFFISSIAFCLLLSRVIFIIITPCNSLVHTTWKGQYHIVFTPKYRRKIIYEALRAEIGKMLRELCKRKEVEIIEAHAMSDHIHKLASIPPNEKASSFMGYLKAKSTMIIFKRYAHMAVCSYEI